MTPLLPYANRQAAGRELAIQLSDRLGKEDFLVLALPRGGLPVGYEVARALSAELDVIVVRKLGLPGRPELAMGAVASGGVCLHNDRVLSEAAVPEEIFQKIAEDQQPEVARRERVYRGDSPPPRIEGRTVILVDDGLATGSTMVAAIQAVRRMHPSRVIVAVPVAPADTVTRLQHEADDVICLAIPRNFYGVGQFYRDFAQLSDSEVEKWLTLGRAIRNPLSVKQ